MAKKNTAAKKSSRRAAKAAAANTSASAATPKAAAIAASVKQPAALDGAEAEIFKLVSAGATPKQWAEWLRVPLEHAAASGNHDLFEKLVDAGATCGAGWKGCGGRTLLYAAALGGNVDVVSAVLQKGSCSEVNVPTTSSRRSALYAAVKAGHEATARKLILAGADVNYEDPCDDVPPLIPAVHGGYGGVVTDLLLAGASPGVFKWYGGYAYPGESLLQIAAGKGHAEVVSALLGANMDVNASEDEFKTSALMRASRGGHLLTVKTLLVAGADPSRQDALCAERALDFAAKQGHTEVLEVLLEHGADVDSRCYTGCAALHNAAWHGQSGATGILLDAGADPNAADKDGKTPLHCSTADDKLDETLCLRRFGQSQSAKHEAARILLQQGANVNALDGDGNTPLHLACSRQYEPAHWPQTDWEGKVTQGFNPETIATVDLLLKWGGSECAVNNASQTPLQRLDTCLDDLRTSTHEPTRRRLAHDTAAAETVRSLLIRAPADRAWRRRCLLVMLRSRHDRERTAPVSIHCTGDTRQQEQKDDCEFAREQGIDGCEASASNEARGAGEPAAKGHEGGVGGIAGAEASRKELVGMVIELMPDHVFHTIVLFL